MTEARILDTTGKTAASNMTYKIDILKRDGNIHLEFDCNWKDLTSNTVEDLIKLALQDKEEVKGKTWYKLSKNEKSNKWERLEILEIDPKE